MQSAGLLHPPTEADIQKLISQLRDDLTFGVRTEVADRIVQLAAAEPHPMAKAALLERAGRLVQRDDPMRCVGLLREAFRLCPTVSAGQRLLELAENDGVFSRLNRLGHLADAVAAVAVGAEDRTATLEQAAHIHLNQGHGQSAAAAIEALLALNSGHAEAKEWLELARQQILAREEALQAQRLEIAQGTEAARPDALLAYAELLLAGDEPLADAAAVVADAVDAGASLAAAAPAWVEVARAMGDPAELVRALSASIVMGEGSPTRLQHADELANIAGLDREHPAAAADALRILCEALPEDLALRARLETVRASMAPDPDAALEEVRHRALRDRDRTCEAVVCLTLAQRAQQRGDMEQAERHFRRVRTLSPQNPESLDFFEDFYRQAGDHKRLLVALTQRLATADGRTVVRIAMEMASLAEGPLEAPERAIEAYQRVIAVQPDHQQATTALDRLYEQLGRWHALRDLLDRNLRALMAQIPNDESVRSQAMAILCKIAWLHEDSDKLPSHELALSAYRQVLALAPNHQVALAALTHHCEQVGDSATWVELLERAATAAADASEAGERSEAAARVATEHLQDLPRAAKNWWKAVEAHPSRVSAAHGLQEVLRKLGDNEGLRRALEAELADIFGTSLLVTLPGDLVRLRHEPVAPRAAILLEEIAGLCEAAADTKAALHANRLLLEVDPGHMGALAALQRLVAGGDRAAWLADVLEDHATRADLSERGRVAVLEALVALCAGPLQDLPRAETMAGRLRSCEPHSDVARSVEARALVSHGDPTALRAAHPRGREGAVQFVAAAVAAAAGRQGLARAAMLQAAGEALRDELEDSEHAAVVLGDALEAAQAVTDAAAAARSTELAHALLDCATQAHLVGLQRIAADSLVALAPPEAFVSARQTRIQVLVRGALWPDAAAACAELVEDMIAGSMHAELLETLREFEDLSERAEDEASLPDRFASWAAILGEDANAQASASQALVWLWRRSAERALRGGQDLGLARHAVDEALRVAHGGRDLLGLRERIATGQADWAAAVDTLEQMAAVEGGEAGTETLLRAATLCDRSLHDPILSARLHRSVLAVRPGSAPAWLGLLAALRDSGDSTALSDALDSLLQNQQLPRNVLAQATLERVTMALDAGQDDALTVAHSRLEALANVSELQDEEESLLAVVAAQVDVPERAVAASRMLLPVAQRHGRSEWAQASLTVLAAAEVAPPERVALFTALADLTERQAPERAFAALRDAFVADPHSQERYERLAHLAARCGRDADLDALLLALIGEMELPGVAPTQDDALRARLCLARAERAMQAGDATTAASLYTLLHQLAPSDLAPLDALEALYREANDGEAVAFILEERLAAHSTQDDRLSTYLRLASVHAEDRDAAAEAEEVLARAVNDFPTSADAWAAWLAALRDSGDRKRLSAALQRRLGLLAAEASSEAAEERHATRLEAADLLSETDQDRQQALELWVAALEVDPTADDVAERAQAVAVHLAATGMNSVLVALCDRLEAVLEARGDWSALDALQAARVQGCDAATRRDLLMRQAFFRERGMAQPAAAFECLAQALRLDPAHAELLSEVRRLGAGGTPDHPPPLAVGRALAAAAVEATDPARRRELRLIALTYLVGDDALLAEIRPIYEAMLADDPADTDALDGLDHWTRVTGDDRTRLTVLAMRAAATANKIEQAALLLEHARLAEVLGDDALALTNLRTVLKQGDRDLVRDAAAALCALHERRGEQRELADSLMVLRDTMEDAEGRLALSLRAAHVLTESGDRERALHLLQGERDEHALEPELFAAVLHLLQAGRDETALLEHLRTGWRDVFAEPSLTTQRVATAAQWLAALQAAGRSPQARWQAVSEVLDVGLRAPSFEVEVASLAQEQPPVADVSLPAARRWIALLQERGDAAGEVSARLVLVERFTAQADARTERQIIAKLLETSLGDADAALAQWQVLLGQTGWDDAIVGEIKRLGDELGRGAQVDELLLAVASGIEDLLERSRACMGLVERAYGRGDLERMADLLDVLLLDDPRHAEAYEMQGNVLAELPEEARYERLASHFRHGIEHAQTAAERLQARAGLARLLHEHLSASDEALDLVCEQLREGLDEGRDALLQLAITYAGGARNSAKLQDLWRIEAERCKDAADRTKAFEALVGAAAVVEANLDVVDVARSLAVANPTDEMLWQQLELAAGTERAHVVRESLLTAEETCEDASLRHDLLAKAGRLAQEAGDSDAGITCWRMALRAEDRPAARLELRNLLRAANRMAELAIELEESGDVARADDVDGLLEAVDLWFGSARHPDRALALLARLAHQWRDRADIADRWLTGLKTVGDSRLAVELESALTGVLARDPEVRARWLPERVAQLRKHGSAKALCDAVHDCIDAGAQPSTLTEALVDLQDRIAELDRGAGLQVLAWRLAGLDPKTAPQAWCAARLAELDLRESPQERRAIWLEVARHARVEMGEPDQALDWLLQAVALGPIDEGLLIEIKSLVHDAASARQVLTALEPALAQQPDLVGAQVFDAAAAWLGNDAQLLPFAAAAAQAQPMDVGAALWLEAKAADCDDFAAWADLLEVRAPRQVATEADAAVAAWLKQADLCRGQLHDAPRAAQALDRLLAVQPSHEAALRMRLELATDLGDLEAIVRLTEALSGLVGAEETAELYVQQAGALEVLGRLDQALTAYELVLAGAPQHPNAIGRRASLLARTGRKKEARAALVEAGSAIVDRRESQMIWLQAAELAEAVQDAAEAAALYVKAGEPARAIVLLLDRARLGQDVVALLEQAGDIARDSSLVEDWLDGIAGLVGADELPAEAVEPAIALAAAAAAELGQAARAADLWQLAWDQDPDSRDAREAVLALRREAGDPARLATDLERALVLGEASERTPLRIELAELRRGPLAKPREALRHVLDVLAEEPNHAEALALAEQLAFEPSCARDAMASLEPIYRTSGNSLGMERVLRQRLERATQRQARAELARRLASLQADQLAAPDAALATLLIGLQADPQLPLLEAAETAARHAADKTPLARAYELTLSGPLSNDQRFEVLRRAAAFDVAQGDVTQAERRLRALIDMRPQATEALEALAALMAAAGRHGDVAALWGQRLEVIQDPALRVPALKRLAEVARSQGKAAVALAALRELAELDSNDAEPRRLAVDLLREGDDAAALAHALGELARLAATPREKAELLCESARLYIRTQSTDRASECYREAFAANAAADEAFVALEKLADHDAVKLHPLYAARTTVLEPSPARTLTLRKLAGVCIELGDAAQACAALEQASLDDADNAVVLDELLRLAELHGQWTVYAGAAQRKLAGDLRREVRIALLGSLARVELTESLDVQAATEHIAELEKLAPKEPITRHVQTLLQTRSGNPAEAATGLERMVKETEDPTAEAALRQQLADLYAGPLENPAKAIREMQKIVALAPQQWSARRQLCDLYATRKSPEAHAECLKQWLHALEGASGAEAGPAKTERAHLQVELGEVLTDLGQAAEALAVLGEAHTATGDGERLNVARSKALELHGDLAAAVAVENWLIQHFDAAKDPVQQGGHVVRAGILWEKLGQPAKARDQFKRALDLSPTDDAATLGYGRACLALDDTDRALRLFDSVGKKTSTDAALRADAYVGMGRCRMSRLQLDEARACYEKALALLPGHAGAKEALSEL